MDEWLGYFAWDVTANRTSGRLYWFLDQEQNVNDLTHTPPKVCLTSLQWHKSRGLTTR